MQALDRIRTPEKGSSLPRQLLLMLLFLFLGAALGAFSKYLDYRQASLPGLLEALDAALDLHNFLGQLAPWLLLGVCIAIYSPGPLWGAARVFFFFLGMVGSYYAYCYCIAGFYPRAYAAIWFGLALLSPFLAYLCWYAKGRGPLAFLLSAGILGVSLWCTLHWGWLYVSLRSGLHLLCLVLGIALLHRSPRETLALLGAALLVSLALGWLLPFSL